MPHLTNPGEGPVGALAVFVVGMFLCLTLRRTGDLWFAIGFHAAFDFGETYLYSVPDSGIVAPGHLARRRRCTARAGSPAAPSVLKAAPSIVRGAGRAGMAFSTASTGNPQRDDAR